MNKISGVIFDVDGTLLDSMPMWEHAGEIYLSKTGITPEPNLGDKLFTMTMCEGAEYIKSTYNLDLSVNEIISGINDTISHFYKEEVQPKIGAIELIETLKLHNIPMTIATATDICHIEAAFNRLGIMDCFTKINTCSDMGMGKDTPDIYIDCAKAMNSDIENTWVFEDAYHAAMTAYKSGFKVVGIYDKSSAAYHSKLQKNSHMCFEYIPGYNTLISTSIKEDI
ncbi:MAG: HAD family hydrolase [Coprococcus sp.]